MATLADLVTMGGAPSYQWPWRRGNDLALSFIVERNGVAVDLTSCTGTCLVKSDYGASATTIATGTVSFPTPASGTVKVTISDANSSITIPAGTADTTGEFTGYPYDVRLTLGADTVTVLRGELLVQRMVS
jgi:hypothetical protein